MLWRPTHLQDICFQQGRLLTFSSADAPPHSTPVGGHEKGWLTVHTLPPSCPQCLTGSNSVAQTSHLVNKPSMKEAQVQTGSGQVSQPIRSQAESGQANPGALPGTCLSSSRTSPISTHHALVSFPQERSMSCMQQQIPLLVWWSTCVRVTKRMRRRKKRWRE